jgi:hypothetical protein
MEVQLKEQWKFSAKAFYMVEIIEVHFFQKYMNLENEESRIWVLLKIRNG